MQQPEKEISRAHDAQDRLNALFDKARALITALHIIEADSEDLEDGADDEPSLSGPGNTLVLETTTAMMRTTARQNPAWSLQPRLSASLGYRLSQRPRGRRWRHGGGSGLWRLTSSIRWPLRQRRRPRRSSPRSSLPPNTWHT
ncbi:hypothetical protein MPLB_1870047 [Mesorhizobium sp. ORS 3324]|nr:hypothetical protein MPLB_1870047 [Mesorhizobium sp. ORS 3324]